MRRSPDYRPELQMALALSDIERLKALAFKVTDGRVLVISTGTDGDDTTPPVEAAAHVLYGSKHTRSFRVTDGGGLDVDFEQGQIWIGGTFCSIGSGSLTLDDDATNYVFVTLLGAVQYNAVGFPNDCSPLAEVTTASGVVTAINDRRSYLAGGLHVWPPAGTIIVEEDGAPIDPQVNTVDFLEPDAVLVASVAPGEISVSMSLYALLGGRTGGQTLIGGLGAGEDLILQSTAHATRGSVMVPDGLLEVGTDDTTSGIVHIYGAAAGDEGGEFRLYMTDAHDAVNEYWAVDVYEDDFRISLPGTNVVTINPNRQMHLHGQGANAGLLIGGDTQLYRHAANQLMLAAGDLLMIADTSFYFAMSGGDPLINFDADDYFTYDRGGNLYTFVINGGAGATLGANMFSLLGGVGMKLRLYDAGAVQYGLGIQANVMEFITDAATDDFRWGHGVSGALTEVMFLDSGTGRLHITGECEIDGDLNHDGTYIGFFGIAPVARAAAYTLTNVNADRAYDADDTTLDELADVLGTLIADLQAYGLLQ